MDTASTRSGETVDDDQTFQFELVNYPPPTVDPLSSISTTSEDDAVVVFRSIPLEECEFEAFFDRDKRIVDRGRFFRTIFRGGVDPNIRPDVWCFLFAFYPCNSTESERSLHLKKGIARYDALKRRWKRSILEFCPTFDLVNMENCLVDGKPLHVQQARELAATTMDEKAKCDSGNCDTLGIVDSMSALEARIFAERCSTQCSLESITESLRYISKDVPRTERQHPMFQENGANLLALRDLLMTFCFHNSSVGYVQGMNDLGSRFLMVMKSEALAFWCFNNYVAYVHHNFMAAGMLQKIQALKRILHKLDPDLFDYLRVCGSDDLIFCHKWLLLCFQREFPVDEGIRLLEILSTHQLELYATQTQQHYETSRRKLFANNGTEMTADESCSSEDCSFDLFICVAILTRHREKIFACNEFSQVFLAMSQLSGKLNLEEILCEAEKLFMRYCHQSVLNSFVLVS